LQARIKYIVMLLKQGLFYPGFQSLRQ
jgi:hypothetical protein